MKASDVRGLKDELGLTTLPCRVYRDADMKASDVRGLKDELGLTTEAAFLRVKCTYPLVRHISDGCTAGNGHLLREGQNVRRAYTEDLGSLHSERQHSFVADVEHAAAETFLLTRLSFTLLRYLGLGYRWISKLLALVLYALLLSPGFLQIAFLYFFSRHIHRSIVYGDQPRNRLDLYLPRNTNIPRPVVIFVTGGAWIIGYKAWGALLGMQLLERDIIVCCIDYRNFPQGGISDMVQDVTRGIGYVVNNIAHYGGDPDRIYLAGQSAGSHVAACAVVNQARIQMGQMLGQLTWKACHLKGFLGISGGYNLPKLIDHFCSRGLYRGLFLSVMEGEASLSYYSPELLVRNASFLDAAHLLPPVHLFHGKADLSIPYDASEKFGDALRGAGVTVTTKFYPGKTHTDVFLQDPLRGGYDPLFEDVLAIVHADDEDAQMKDAKAPPRQRLVPECLLRLARRISPF